MLRARFSDAVVPLNWTFAASISIWLTDCAGGGTCTYEAQRREELEDGVSKTALFNCHPSSPHTVIPSCLSHKSDDWFLFWAPVIFSPNIGVRQKNDSIKTQRELHPLELVVSNFHSYRTYASIETMMYNNNFQNWLKFKKWKINFTLCISMLWTLSSCGGGNWFGSAHCNKWSPCSNGGRLRMRRRHRVL